MKKKNVLIIGGRGFLGSAIRSELKNCKVFTFDRNPGDNNHFQGNISSVNDLINAMKNIDIVINLVGLSPLKKPKIPYNKMHVEGVKNIIKACKLSKIKKLIHVSALGADKNSTIEYIRTKGIGEELVLKSGLNVNVFCPSVIYDNESELIKMFEKTSFILSFPNITARIQPIYRKDIAKLFALAVENRIKERKLEAAGPNIFTIFEIAKKVYNKKGLPCIPIPLFLVVPLMYIASMFSLFSITRDQIKSLKIDNVSAKNKAGKYLKLTAFDIWLNKVYEIS